jgi:hypothetical protein
MVTLYNVSVSSNLQGSRMLPEDGTPLLKHVGARILNKEVI